MPPLEGKHLTRLCRLNLRLYFLEMVLNRAVELIGLFQNDLRNKKAERLDDFIKTFGNVGRGGAFSNQFIEGMKLLYELEPLIQVKPYLTNQWEKRGLAAKRAS